MKTIRLKDITKESTYETYKEILDLIKEKFNQEEINLKTKIDELINTPLYNSQSTIAHYSADDLISSFRYNKTHIDKAFELLNLWKNTNNIKEHQIEDLCLSTKVLVMIYDLC